MMPSTDLVIVAFSLARLRGRPIRNQAWPFTADHTFFLVK